MRLLATLIGTGLIEFTTLVVVTTLLGLLLVNVVGRLVQVVASSLSVSIIVSTVFINKLGVVQLLEVSVGLAISELLLSEISILLHHEQLSRENHIGVGNLERSIVVTGIRVGVHGSLKGVGSMVERGGGVNELFFFNSTSNGDRLIFRKSVSLIK